MNRFKVLVVDDEPGVRFGIRGFFEAKECEVFEAETCDQAEKVCSASRPDFAVLDFRLPDGDALFLLPRLKRIDSDLSVVILTGHGSIDVAVQAIKEGAEHFLTKPVEMHALYAVAERVVENQRNRRKQRAGTVRTSRYPVDPFIGQSAAMRQLAEQARKVARSDSPVLLQGETGTGKGVLAAWLHHHSSRTEEAFVDLNCAGLTREFLESELFGHEKGAYTGAVAAKAGLLEVAHRGTIFLDEIGDMDQQVQPKLLKVLEEKRFRRMGSVNDRKVDIRLIAATHRSLNKLVKEDKFRDDLYFRISTIPLYVPALRERVEDIIPLARSTLRRISNEMGRAGEIALSPDAEQALRNYSWPGNIRELRNVLERAVLLSNRSVLDSDDLLFRDSIPGATSDMTLLEAERRHIRKVLQQEQGHVERAAKKLGIPRSSLYQKLKKLGISPY